MPKESKNSLNTRREFYIHRIVRNGKMYDEETPKQEEPIIQTTSKEKRKISYAESFGYREDPKRYDFLNPKKTEEEKERERREKVLSTIQNTQLEPPLVDEQIGYFDDGLIDESDLENTIDQLYQETFSNEEMEISNDDLVEPMVPTPQTVTPTFVQTDEIVMPETHNVSVETIVESPKPQPQPKLSTEPRAPIMEKAVQHVKIEEPKRPLPQKGKRSKYIAPSYDLLTCSDERNSENEDEAKRQAEVINKTFKESGIRAEVARFIFGPTVTQFLITIEEGANIKDIRKAEANLLMYLQCESIRIQTPIPGKPFGGIEVPKKPENRRTVFLGDMLTCKEFKNLDYQVPVAVGQDNYGNYHYIDLTEMPHGLVAGTTKSGKSVCLNAFLLSLIYRFTPDQLRLVLIDPKRIELGVYEGIPHLAMPVVTDQEDFQSALGWVYEEMENRYKEFELYGERNIVDYNEIRKEQHEKQMAYMIVIMDEFSDWFADANSEIEMYMQKLAQKARAAGINIILATQRPSKDVIKGTIKANFDTRIAFRVTGFADSQVILGNSGAEKLEGKGDMLIRYAGRSEQRLQGAFVPNSDIKKVTRFLRENNTCEYIVTKEEIHQSTVSRQAATSSIGKTLGRDDPRFEEVAYWIVRNKNASMNQLTQNFGMGFNRINDIVMALEQMGVLSPGVKGKQREVLMDEFEFTQLLEADE